MIGRIRRWLNDRWRLRHGWTIRLDQDGKPSWFYEGDK